MHCIPQRRMRGRMSTPTIEFAIYTCIYSRHVDGNAERNLNLSSDYYYVTKIPLSSIA